MREFLQAWKIFKLHKEQYPSKYSSDTKFIIEVSVQYYIT